VRVFSLEVGKPVQTKALLSDVLEVLVAEIGDREIEPRPDLAIGVLGKTDGRGQLSGSR
jgi:hypothetical protein